jgi:hypothetical protein
VWKSDLLELVDPAVKHAPQLKSVAAHLNLPEAEVLKAAVDADPTKNKDYVGWLLKQMKMKNIILPEDAPRVIAALETLEKAKKIKLKDVEPDINKYQKFSDLEAVTDKLTGDNVPTANRQQRTTTAAGATWVKESPNYKILRVTTPEACVLYGKHTKWCTKDLATAKGYIEKYGELFVVFEKK